MSSNKSAAVRIATSICVSALYCLTLLGPVDGESQSRYRTCYNKELGDKVLLGSTNADTREAEEHTNRIGTRRSHEPFNL